MATRRRISTITIHLKDGSTPIDITDASLATTAFNLIKGECGGCGECMLDINDGTSRRLINRNCICTVDVGAIVEDTVPGFVCDTIDCIPDYP